MVVAVCHTTLRKLHRNAIENTLNAKGKALLGRKADFFGKKARKVRVAPTCDYLLKIRGDNLTFIRLAKPNSTCMCFFCNLIAHRCADIAIQDANHYEYFDLRDVESTRPEFQFGLLCDDYTPKPAFDRYRQLIAELD